MGIPWFIFLFLLAAVARSVAGAGFDAAFDAIAGLARVGLTLTLLLIGAGLTRATFRAIGFRPFLQGVALWVAVAGITLIMVRAG